jgi:DNA polymerase
MKMLFDLYEKVSPNPRFNDLIQTVQHCDLCPRLCCQNKILSSSNGNIESKVLFVAEAPGRLGADKTGIPLYGDRTGSNFESLLGNIGWKREDVFITNAVLCNPKNDSGNNRTPTQEEIDNCSVYLEMTISLINPEVIITLGQTALAALNMISPHNLQLSQDVAKPK